MREPLFETPRLTVRLAMIEDAPAMRDFYVRNRAFLQPWYPTFDEQMFDTLYWQERLQASLDEFELGRSVRLALFDGDGRAVGIANFTSVRYSPIYCCVLGYSLDGDVQGRGLMEEALRPAIKHLFEALRMHRIEANYMPRNERSGRLLTKLGFVVEGRAKAYLQIDGRWEDHVLTSLTNERWEPI